MDIDIKDVQSEPTDAWSSHLSTVQGVTVAHYQPSLDYGLEMTLFPGTEQVDKAWKGWPCEEEPRAGDVEFVPPDVGLRASSLHCLLPSHY